MTRGFSGDGVTGAAKNVASLNARSKQAKRVKCLIPIIQRAAKAKQAKTVCVRAGHCGAGPPVFRLVDGLIYILFLSHFSVFLRNDVYV
jgi:hypothetical protein